MLGLRRIHIGSGCKQHPAGFDIALASGILERSHTPFGALHERPTGGFLKRPEFKPSRTGIDIGAMPDEQLGNLSLILGCGEHQRGVSLELVGSVDIGASVNQQFHSVEIARTGSQHERSFTRTIGSVRIRSGFQEGFHHCEIAQGRGFMKSIDAVAVRRLHIGSGGNQKLSGFGVAVVSRPDQGCRPVDIRSVGIHMLLQQSPDHGDVTVFDGIDEARIVERGGGYEARCQ